MMGYSSGNPIVPISGPTPHQWVSAANAGEAEKLLGIGVSPRPAEIPVQDFAAMTMTANLLLNLDETITRE